MSVRIIQGDCLLRLPELPENSIDSCVTDPPYHLTSIVKRFGAENAAPAKYGTDGAYARASRGFMGKQWDGGDIAFRPETWAAVLRVLKPGAYLCAFGGTRTFHRMMVAIEDAGFELRDTAMWVYGSGFPKSHDVIKGIEAQLKTGGSGPKNMRMLDRGADTDRDYKAAPGITTQEAAEWAGWGTALKPAWEPIAIFRKPLEGRLTVAQNVLKWGTGAMNIDVSRVEGSDNKKFERAPGNVSRENYRKGTTVGPAIPVDYGRWPANVLHDGSDEVMASFPDAPGQQRSVGPEHGEKTSVNTYGDYGPRDDFQPRGDTGSAARFFYTAKADSADRAGSKHPTVKPTDLMRWLVNLVTQPGGTVLDPFCGTGSTLLAADQLQMNAIGIEADATYAADALRKISGDCPMFAEVAA